jgi:hypothetical protein
MKKKWNEITMIMMFVLVSNKTLSCLMKESMTLESQLESPHFMKQKRQYEHFDNKMQKNVKRKKNIFEIPAEKTI